MSDENKVNEELTQDSTSQEAEPERKEPSVAPEEPRGASFDSTVKAVMAERAEAEKKNEKPAEEPAVEETPSQPPTPGQQFSEMLQATAREEGIDSPELRKMCDKLSEVMTQSMETNKKNAWIEAARKLAGDPDDETLLQVSKNLLDNPIVKNIGLSPEQEKALSLSIYAESMKNSRAPKSESIPIPVPAKTAPKSKEVPSDLLSKTPQEITNFIKKMRS